MDFNGLLKAANTRLKTGNIGLRIEQNGERLCLRGTFPPKPGSEKTIPFQQRLFTGHRANSIGLKALEAEAKTIGGLLATGKFDWAPYLKQKPKAEPSTVAEWVERLHDKYLAEDGKESTWLGDYWTILKKLPQDETLSRELLHECVLGTQPNTRSRQRACMAIGAIAKLAEINYDPSKYRGNYGPQAVDPRNLPGDELIVEWFHKIQNPSWRWVYGMMAAYGLRNHEVFRLDFDQIRAGHEVVAVGRATKTGARKVWPYMPEWWIDFELQNVQLPRLNLERDNISLGHAVNEYFLDHGIPFAPYNLRHAWAVRTLVLGVPWQIAAKQMGHSAEVHEKTYHRWIKDDVSQTIHEAIKAKRLQSNNGKVP